MEVRLLLGTPRGVAQRQERCVRDAEAPGSSPGTPTMVESKKEKEVKQVEISFGTLFKVKQFGKETDRVDVVIDTGEKNYFFAAEVLTNDEGERIWWPSGTAGLDNLGKIIGQMTPEEVIEAKRRGCRRLGYEMSKEEFEILHEYSRKGPRVLILASEDCN